MAPSSSNYTISHYPTAEKAGESSRSAQFVLSAPKTRLEARDAIVSSLAQILEQPLGMLRDGTVGDRQMAAESQLIPGSSFGKHLRHVHDHYRVLLDSISASASRGGDDDSAISLDYDKRMRSPPLETSAKTALAEFEETQRRIRELFSDENSAAETDKDRSLDRRITLSATTPAEVEIGSTLGREMWFVCLHAIHHFALARVILVHELGLKIDDNFGVAPSTLLFREWNRAVQSKL